MHFSLYRQTMKSHRKPDAGIVEKHKPNESTGVYYVLRNLNIYRQQEYYLTYGYIKAQLRWVLFMEVFVLM